MHQGLAARKNQHKSKIFTIYLSVFWLLFISFFFALLAAPARERTLKKQVFAWSVLHFLCIRRLRAEPKREGTLKKHDCNNNLKTHRKTNAETQAKRIKKECKMITNGSQNQSQSSQNRTRGRPKMKENRKRFASPADPLMGSALPADPLKLLARSLHGRATSCMKWQ